MVTILRHTNNDWRPIFSQTMVGGMAAIHQAADRKKVATMISLIGKSTCSTLNGVCPPEIPSAKTYKQLCEIL